MSVLVECLSHTSLGKPRTHLNLDLNPLLSGRQVEPTYLLLDDAWAQGRARVTEVSESGGFPDLRFINHAGPPRCIEMVLRRRRWLSS